MAEKSKRLSQIMRDLKTSFAGQDDALKKAEECFRNMGIDSAEDMLLLTNEDWEAIDFSIRSRLKLLLNSERKLVHQRSQLNNEEGTTIGEFHSAKEKKMAKEAGVILQGENIIQDEEEEEVKGPNAANINNNLKKQTSLSLSLSDILRKDDEDEEKADLELSEDDLEFEGDDDVAVNKSSKSKTQVAASAVATTNSAASPNNGASHQINTNPIAKPLTPSAQPNQNQKPSIVPNVQSTTPKPTPVASNIANTSTNTKSTFSAPSPSNATITSPSSTPSSTIKPHAASPPITSPKNVASTQVASSKNTTPAQLPATKNTTIGSENIDATAIKQAVQDTDITAKPTKPVKEKNVMDEMKKKIADQERIVQAYSSLASSSPLGSKQQSEAKAKLEQASVLLQSLKDSAKVKTDRDLAIAQLENKIAQQKKIVKMAEQQLKMGKSEDKSSLNTAYEEAILLQGALESNLKAMMMKKTAPPPTESGVPASATTAAKKAPVASGDSPSNRLHSTASPANVSSPSQSRRVLTQPNSPQMNLSPIRSAADALPATPPIAKKQTLPADSQPASPAKAGTPPTQQTSPLSTTTTTTTTSTKESGTHSTQNPKATPSDVGTNGKTKGTATATEATLTPAGRTSSRYSGGTVKLKGESPEISHPSHYLNLLRKKTVDPDLEDIPLSPESRPFEHMKNFPSPQGVRGILKNSPNYTAPSLDGSDEEDYSDFECDDEDTKQLMGSKSPRKAIVKSVQFEVEENTS